MNINAMRILSIDEDVKSLSIIQDYAHTLSLEVDSFEDSQKALVSFENTNYDVILIEYECAQDSGWNLLKTLRHINSDIPIIVLAEYEVDVNLQAKALHLGAHEILNKPLNASLFQARVQNTLKLKKAESLLNNETLLLQNEIAEATKEFKGNEQEALEVLAKSVAYKDHKLDNHTLVMAHYSQTLAKLAGLNEKVQDIAFHATAFYDLGKVGISDEILLKPGKLDEDEREIMKTHARIGYDILKYSQSSYLKAGAVISYSHHEKYDGSGYPIGLSGETIPILGRIVSIAHVFDALISSRAHKKAWSIEEACAFLVEEKGKSFDPRLVDLFIENIEKMIAIKNKFSDHK